MNGNHFVRFSLHISPDDYKSYYQGMVENVEVRAHDGRLVLFPASALRRYVTMNGIHGVFELEFDQRNKLVALRRLQ